MTALSLLSRPPLWRESRVGLELATLVRDPVFRGDGVKDGRGQPVLLIPGFLAGDDSLALMTRWLRSTNHYAKRAGMRMNVDCSEAAVQRLEEKVEILVERQGQRAAIVGQSRGGHFARVLATRRPDLVAGIVTLGSPLTDPLAIHPVVRAHVYAVGALGTVGVRGLFRHSCLWGDCCTDFWADAQAPFPKGVRFVSVYSRSDGVVRWRACLDPHAEHLEIRASHIGMGDAAPGGAKGAAQGRRPQRADQAGCVAGFCLAQASISLEPWTTWSSSVTSSGTQVLPVRRLTSLRPDVWFMKSGRTPRPYDLTTSGSCPASFSASWAFLQGCPPGRGLPNVPQQM
jgi:pimeloyl-ACP methyl ester carboxylesterase